MIVIVDYGVGNSGAVRCALRRVGVDATVSKSVSDIEKAERLILPGVGAFDFAMARLAPLISVLSDKVLKQKCPILGICLGMQVFAEKSEEGIVPGLGWVKGSVKKMVGEIRVPHMGWNTVIGHSKSDLFRNVEPESWFYFIHSFHFAPESEEYVVGKTSYGAEIVSAIQKDNIFGVQFHPEKSHRHGLRLLRNFVEYRG